MDTRLLKRLCACVFLLLVAGCGLFRFDTRAPWRDEAEQKCLSSGQVQITPAIEASRELDGPGACGMLQPFRVSALAEGSVALKSKATLACPMIPVVDKWVEEIVQPAAKLYFGTRVAELNAGSYSCRNQNNSWFGDASEHAFGNAVDVMGFRFADGREMSVVKGWKGQNRDQEFLREIFVNACDYFTTVLAPGSDAYHYNHIHMDLARHDAYNQRRICKPKIQFARKIDPKANRLLAVTQPPATDEPAVTGTLQNTPLPQSVSTQEAKTVDLGGVY